MTGIPQQLTDYLVTMISPPPRFGQAVVLGDLASVDWPSVATWPDNSVQGFVAVGEPTPEQSKELMRVMRPGAHLCLIAPEENPLGDIGTCNIEDAGLEIRDSILWVREAGSFHYVPKSKRTERELGCEYLPARSGADAVDRKEGSAGTHSPRAGAGRTAESVQNHHPTVKPIDMMEFLLHDIPITDKPVLDPFLGSGTTGIACLGTGHPFVGIEREMEYLKVADARVRYWAASDWMIGTNIESDVPPDDHERETLDSMFGWGDDD